MKDSAFDFLGFAFKPGKTRKSGKYIVLKPASQKKPRLKSKKPKPGCAPACMTPWIKSPKAEHGAEGPLQLLWGPQEYREIEKLLPVR